MFRRLVGMPQVLPGFSNEALLAANQQRLESIVLSQASGELVIPVDERVATLIPFRGPGGGWLFSLYLRLRFIEGSTSCRLTGGKDRVGGHHGPRFA